MNVEAASDIFVTSSEKTWIRRRATEILIQWVSVNTFNIFWCVYVLTLIVSYHIFLVHKHCDKDVRITFHQF